MRAFRPNDEAAIQAYAGDPEVVRYCWWGPNTPEMTQRFLRIALAEQRVWPRDGVTLALELKSDDRLIGAVRFYLKDGVHRLGEIGFVLNRAFWGQGFAVEASRAVVNAAFHRLRLHRVCATCDSRNQASARVLEKLGMREEGLFRQDVLQKGEWRDSRFYAILSGEWPAEAPSYS